MAQAANNPAEPWLCNECCMKFTPNLIELDRPREFPRKKEHSHYDEVGEGFYQVLEGVANANLRGDARDTDYWKTIGLRIRHMCINTKNFQDWGKQDHERFLDRKLTWNQVGIRKSTKWRDTRRQHIKSISLRYLESLLEP